MAENKAEVQVIDDDDEGGALGFAEATKTSDGQIRLLSATLDKQIMTARAFPRSVVAFKSKCSDLLKSDPATAAAAEYAKPVGRDLVSGPSVRLAELMLLCWGNIKVTLTEPIISATNVVVHASAWDMETNSECPAMSSTSIVGRNGRFPNHLIETVALATAAKAKRNAIIGIIPRAYVNEMLVVARNIVNKTDVPLPKRRADSLSHFARAYKVPNEKVFEFLDVKGADDMTTEDIEKLKLIVTAIQTGEAKIDEFFDLGEKDSKVSGLKEQVKAKREEKTRSLAGGSTNAADGATSPPVVGNGAENGASKPEGKPGALFGDDGDKGGAEATDDKSQFLKLFKEFLELGGMSEEILQGEGVDETELLAKLNKPALAKRTRFLQGKITALRNEKK